MLKKKNSIGVAILVVITAFSFFGVTQTYAKNVSAEKQIEVVKKNAKSAQEVLADIDKYQEQYFTIIKRNDVLLQDEDNKILNRDRKKLKNLYKKVQKQITNNVYMKDYRDIEKRYANCDCITTPEMNEFAHNYYKEVDALLNKVYQEVKSKISPEDFKNLVQSETEWLKEVENYKKVFDSMGFGTIGTLVYCDYEVNMRQFRTLLLLLYL